ncbi:target of rapamycin complex 2 subunit MAPKAP1-like isoform X2 [Mya arenaria]|uniref:target of rapamycin complex 2 subunit MAPKAP1-like isoform X2 n=1 Tax=Mya arenaria TaxID=6604 RepID=UPI0022DE9871|nr:target of rapamycin complex 2 subunit MAPKAP1-like isoform X2 [Mya arenaria]
MAMMDNREFLISHIRNSFITSDDTGMCEMIIDVDDEKNRSGAYTSDSGMESSDSEMSNSYDILPDMDYGAHRRRSNTSQRLERMKKEKRNQSRVKNITWKDTNVDFDEKSQLFEKKSLPDPETTCSFPSISRLSEQLHTSASMGENPFLEYAKFDGKASVGVATKKIDIFLTMALPDDRPYPISVVVVSTAKIQDLIGLICWQYTIEMREPMLHENTDMYCLHIAEDDGEVDTDFPSLDSREPISKFGFTKLALVEKDVPTHTSRNTIIVTVNIPHRGFNKFQIENANVTMKEILEKVLKRRKIKVRPGQCYNLEKQSVMGVPVDLEATIASMDTLDFVLVRENSSRGDSEVMEDTKTSKMAESLTSHQYKSYIVSMVHKLRTNTEVQLGVSGEKVEIDPVVGKGSARLFRQRAVTYAADNIAACDIMEDKDGGKSVFRLTYFSGHEFKHHDFEAETNTCNEIVQKFNNILELRLSPVRKEYVAIRDRKMLRKRDSLMF